MTTHIEQEEDIDAFIESVGFKSKVADADETSPRGLFDFASLNLDRMEPAPIPADWIVEGQPMAKCQSLSVGDRGWTTTDHWSCTKGTFKWHFDWDETILFLEGEVIITDENGEVFTGKPGTSMHFPAGSSATWEVPHYVRKIAFNRRPLPALLHHALRLAEKLAPLFRDAKT